MGHDRTIAGSIAVAIVVLVKGDPFVVPGTRRQSQYDVLLFVEGMVLVVDDDPRPGPVGRWFERVRSEDDVAPFQVVEGRSGSGCHS